jgi:hypothetical protein
MQLVGYLGQCAWQADRVTPSRSSAIVEDTRRELRRALLDDQIIHTNRASPGQEHNGRASTTRSMEHQTPAFDMVEPPYGRATIARCGSDLR